MKRRNFFQSAMGIIGGLAASKIAPNPPAPIAHENLTAISIPIPEKWEGVAGPAPDAEKLEAVQQLMKEVAARQKEMIEKMFVREFTDKAGGGTTTMIVHRARKSV